MIGQVGRTGFGSNRQVHLGSRVWPAVRFPTTAALLVLLAGCSGFDPGAGSPPTATGRPLGLDLEPFLAGLDDPVFLTHAGDGSGRLFIVEQAGVIRVWDGTLLETPLLDVASGSPHDRVLAGGERGLLGLAFHPNHADNGRFFVYYTAYGGDLTLSEFVAPDPAIPVADPDSERILLTIEHSRYPNHNGGMIAFGPDGHLYVGTGDGGFGGDPDNNAQNKQSLLGKILRLDVDNTGTLPYLVPPDNPFSGVDGRAEVWAFGLRNPWRFSFDRGGPEGEGRGGLWIGDVGQNMREEIDHEPAGGPGGRNYGWSRYEGSHTYDASRDAPGAVDPVAEYDHGWGGGHHQAVTGGYVYRGADYPDLQGTYLFADFASGFVWSLRPDGDGWAMAKELDTDLYISSFGEDEAGELYVVDLGGEIHRVVAA